MVTIEVEVRFANFMEGCPEYFDATKTNAIKKIVLDCLVIAAPKVPGLLTVPFSVGLDKKWSKLPNTAYFFKEDPKAPIYSICFLRRKRIVVATAEICRIFLIGPNVPDALITYGYA